MILLRISNIRKRLDSLPILLALKSHFSESLVDNHVENNDIVVSISGSTKADVEYAASLYFDYINVKYSIEEVKL